MIEVFLILVFSLISSGLEEKVIFNDSKDQSQTIQLNSLNQVNKSKFNGTTQLSTVQFINSNNFFIIFLFLNLLIVIVGFIIIWKTIKAMLIKASNNDSNLIEFTNETEFIYM